MPILTRSFSAAVRPDEPSGQGIGERRWEFRRISAMPATAESPRRIQPALRPCGIAEISSRRIGICGGFAFKVPPRRVGFNPVSRKPQAVHF
jgi:hypothetical protein